MLIVTVEATDAGYQVVDTRRGMGAPNPSIDQDRDVLFTALGASRTRLASVSVFNPRVGHTTGVDNPRQIILPRGTITVRFADPEEIELVEVTVRRGPNSNYSERLDVKRGTP